MSGLLTSLALRGAGLALPGTAVVTPRAASRFEPLAGLASPAVLAEETSERAGVAWVDDPGAALASRREPSGTPASQADGSPPAETTARLRPVRPPATIDRPPAPTETASPRVDPTAPARDVPQTRPVPLLGTPPADAAMTARPAPTATEPMSLARSPAAQPETISDARQEAAPHPPPRSLAPTAAVDAFPPAPGVSRLTGAVKLPTPPPDGPMSEAAQAATPRAEALPGLAPAPAQVSAPPGRAADQPPPVSVTVGRIDVHFDPPAPASPPAGPPRSRGFDGYARARRGLR